MVLFSIVLEYKLQGIKESIDISHMKKMWHMKEIQYGNLQIGFNPSATKHQVFKGNDIKIWCNEKENNKITYSNVVGNLMYCMVCTIFDIAYAIDIGAQFMSFFSATH